MPYSTTPPVSRELVRYMSTLFPDRAPDPSETEREIWMAVGAARVIRKLAHMEEESHKALLGLRTE